MDKFTFFDFIAFIVPGGTLLILFYTWLCFNFPQWGFKASPDSILWSIPLIFFAFVLGHLMSWLGKLADNHLIEHRCRSFVKGFKEAHMQNDELTQLFPELMEVFDDERLTRNEQYNRAYTVAENYLDVQDKNKLAVILQSQYTFFRNAMATSICIVLFFFLVLVAHYGFDLELCGQIALYWLGGVTSILLALCCFVLMVTRKKLMVTRTFKTLKSLKNIPLK